MFEALTRKTDLQAPGTLQREFGPHIFPQEPVDPVVGKKDCDDLTDRNGIIRAVYGLFQTLKDTSQLLS